MAWPGPVSVPLCEWRPLAMAALLALLHAVRAQAAELGPELQRALATRGTHADTSVIVRFRDALDLQAYATGDRRQRDNRLVRALQAHLERQDARMRDVLAQADVSHVRRLWIINGVALTLPAHAVSKLAAVPGVARIDLDSHVQGSRHQRTPAPRASGGQPAHALVPVDALSMAGAAESRRMQPEWNILAVHAPALWAQGQTGRGVVVASMDTGIDLSHPDLRRRWRGGSNSWFDPHQEEATPYDATGHGTQSLAIALGGSGVGMAPDARWIAARLFDSNGRARMSDIHLAFQWLLDPDGDPATLDAPDIVNASWSLTGRAAGSCILEFSEDIQALRSAGIALVFAAGNDGPAPGTSSSPGNNPGALSVGAVTRELELARQTSRGPSACDGSTFPRLLAPGVNIRTADLSHGGVSSYTYVSGSSLAAPHVTGALALLAAAFPHASVADLEAALTASAATLTPATGTGPERSGLLDVQAAFERLHLRHEPAMPIAGRLPDGRISLANEALLPQESASGRAP